MKCTQADGSQTFVSAHRCSSGGICQLVAPARGTPLRYISQGMGDRGASRKQKRGGRGGCHTALVAAAARRRVEQCSDCTVGVCEQRGHEVNDSERRASVRVSRRRPRRGENSRRRKGGGSDADRLAKPYRHCSEHERNSGFPALKQPCKQMLSVSRCERTSIRCINNPCEMKHNQRTLAKQKLKSQAGPRPRRYNASRNQLATCDHVRERLLSALSASTPLSASSPPPTPRARLEVALSSSRTVASMSRCGLFAARLSSSASRSAAAAALAVRPSRPLASAAPSVPAR